MFFDTTGENFDGNAHMDISSVDVTDDGTNITFKINVSAASITSPADWGKYVIGIDKASGTGDLWQSGGESLGPQHHDGRWDGCLDRQLGRWWRRFSAVDVRGRLVDAERFWRTGDLAGNSTTITTSLASLGLGSRSDVPDSMFTRPAAAAAIARTMPWPI